MKIQHHVCDRCMRPFDGNHKQSFGRKLTVHYHHEKELELCKECEGSFTLWLRKHPGGSSSLDAILRGLATGDGYPYKEQADAFFRARIFLADKGMSIDDF